MESLSEKLMPANGSFSTDLPEFGMDGDNMDVSQFVAFSIGEQQYCVDIMQVREIRAWDGATTLPNSADYIRGVINLRGHIVPVIDLRARFGQGTTDTAKGAVIVIVMIREKLHGLLVDAVSDILSVKTDAVAAAPESASDSGLLSGIITREEQMVAIIALDRLAVD
jgi:purine-binding chemotaxis protein CheW